MCIFPTTVLSRSSTFTSKNPNQEWKFHCYSACIQIVWLSSYASWMWLILGETSGYYLTWHDEVTASMAGAPWEFSRGVTILHELVGIDDLQWSIWWWRNTWTMCYNIVLCCSKYDDEEQLVNSYLKNGMMFDTFLNLSVLYVYYVL